MSEAERRQQILEAAMRLFAREGYHKASIKAIAREAGVKSSALIYWYFTDKAELFNAVITELSPLGDMPLLDEQAAQMMDVPPEVLLPNIARSVLSMQDDPQAIAMMKLYLIEAARSEEAASVMTTFQKHMSGFLEQYLQHHINAGTLRPHDVATAARMLVGTMIIHLLGSQIFIAMKSTFPAREDYITGAVDIFLHGVSAGNNETE